MAKRSPMKDPAAGNPRVVLRAFAPETELVMSLQGWMLLEAMDNALTRGERPDTRDIILAVLTMRDAAAVRKAHQVRKLEDLIAAATKGQSVGDIMAYLPTIAAAIEAAFEPTAEPTATGEKKSHAAPAGA